MVIARTVPLDLLVKEREAARNNMTEGERKAARVETICLWQERWGTSEADVWLHKLMPDISKW